MQMQSPTQAIDSTEYGSLIERSRRATVLLDTFLFRRHKDPLERAVLFLLQHQDEMGSWGTVDYPPWTDVITGMTLQLLHSLGFHEASEWEITRGESAVAYRGGLSRAVTYLLTSQRSTGQWGEDFFDTCQVIKALIPFRPRFNLAQAIDCGLDFVRTRLNADWDRESDSEWYGPGFIAAAVELFNILGDHDTVNELLELLYQHQQNDGAFFSEPVLGSTDINELAVWHTAWAILAMHSLGLPPTAQRLASAVSWLETHQNPDGSWGFSLTRQRAIFTSYGILALATVAGLQSQYVMNGINWLAHQQAEDGRVGDQAGTLMAALVFSRIFPKALSTSIPINVLLDIQQLISGQREFILSEVESLRRLSDEIQVSSTNLDAQTLKIKGMSQQLAELSEENVDLRSQVDAWKTLWDSHPVRLSARFLAVTGWIVGLVSLILAILALFGPNVVSGISSLLSPSPTPLLP